MSLNLFNKKEKEEQQAKQNASIDLNAGVTSQDVDRLAKEAGHIIAMFEQVCPDKMERLKLVSALAGHACHQAVKANGGKLVNVETEDGLVYYFGDAVNYYLLESPYSVLGFIKGYYVNKAANPKELDIDTPIKSAVSNVGDSTYKIWGQYVPGEVFGQAKDCWEGIYRNMTARYCVSPSEWPVLYGIVLQNIMFRSDLEAEDTFFKALECMLHISKMDDKSVKHKDLNEAQKDMLYNFYKDGQLVEISEEDKTFFKSSIDVLMDFLKESKIAFQVTTSGTEAKIFNFKMLINNQVTAVYVAFESQPKTCRIELKIPYTIDKNKANALCAELIRYNYGRRFGAFQYNEIDGDLCYRMAFPCTEGLKKEDFITAFIPSMNAVSKYMDDLKRFVL